jgi:hypothetical protein
MENRRRNKRTFGMVVSQYYIIKGKTSSALHKVAIAFSCIRFWVCGGGQSIREPGPCLRGSALSSSERLWGFCTIGEGSQEETHFGM